MVWETGAQSQVESYQRLKKWYLMPTCFILGINKYVSRVRGALMGKEQRSFLRLGVVAIEKGGILSPVTTVEPLMYIYIYIYIKMKRSHLIKRNSFFVLFIFCATRVRTHVLRFRSPLL